MRGHVTKKGSKWYFVLDIGVDSTNNRKQQWFGSYDKKKDAQNAMNIKINELNQNMFVSPDKLTTGEYLINWLETYCLPNLQISAFESYEIIIMRHLIPNLGCIPLQKLITMHIQQYYAKALKRGRLDGKGGLSNKTVHYHHRVLKHALSHAVDMQLLTRNPADSAKPPKPQKFSAKFLDEEGVAQYLAAAQGTRMEIPILLAIALGPRRGEVLGFKWPDLDHNRKILTVNRTLIYSKKGLIFKPPKSEESNRSLKITDTIIATLKRHKAAQAERMLLLGDLYTKNDLICCHDDGQPIHPSTFGHWYTDWIKENNLPKVRFHDLRHTNATLMLKSNIPAKVASQRLGHSGISITMDLYSHILDSMQEEAANAIEDILFKKTNGR